MPTPTLAVIGLKDVDYQLIQTTIDLASGFEIQAWRCTRELKSADAAIIGGRHAQAITDGLQPPRPIIVELTSEPQIENKDGKRVLSRPLTYGSVIQLLKQLQTQLSEQPQLLTNKNHPSQPATPVATEKKLQSTSDPETIPENSDISQAEATRTEKARPDTQTVTLADRHSTVLTGPKLELTKKTSPQPLTLVDTEGRSGESTHSKSSPVDTDAPHKHDAIKEIARLEAMDLALVNILATRSSHPNPKPGSTARPLPKIVAATKKKVRKTTLPSQPSGKAKVPRGAGVTPPKTAVEIANSAPVHNPSVEVADQVNPEKSKPTVKKTGDSDTVDSIDLDIEFDIATLEDLTRDQPMQSDHVFELETVPLPDVSQTDTRFEPEPADTVSRYSSLPESTTPSLRKPAPNPSTLLTSTGIWLADFLGAAGKKLKPLQSAPLPKPKTPTEILDEIVRPARRFYPAVRFLGLLRSALSEGENKAFRHRGFATIYIYPQSQWFSFAGDLDQCIQLFRVTAMDFEIIDLDSNTKEIPEDASTTRPLWVLSYYAALYGSKGRIMQHTNPRAGISLRAPPDFTKIPNSPAYSQITEYLTEHNASLSEIGEATGISLCTIIDFTNACREIQLVEEVQASSPEPVDEPAPTHSPAANPGLMQRIRSSLQRKN